jgi:hypothetical protein
MIKSFSQYIVEADNKAITFVFGRFNPPTNGHEVLFNKLKAVSKGSYRIYSSKSEDPKKNPLSFKDKVKFLRKMFPKHARSIMADKNVRTAMDICVLLYDQGYTEVSMVVGSDRLQEFDKLLNKYNNVKSRHGYYNFENGISVISAGERDPDADDASGMSASKMRAAAAGNDFDLFSKGLPKTYKDGTSLFNAVRKGLGLKETYNHYKKIKLDSVSDLRESYIEGNLFHEGQKVILKETKEFGTIKMLGSNYVSVVINKGEKPKRYWLEDVSIVEEHGGGDIGTPDLINRYQKDTPGENKGWKTFLAFATEEEFKRKNLKPDWFMTKSFAEIRTGLKEGTMETGIFSDNKDEAEKMAAELVMFMRKNKDVKVGDEASQAYADGITKYIYDDKLLDALDAETGKTGEDCNSIVAARLKELGVKIH